MDKKILFYVSGHGFGHSTRINAVINKIGAMYDGVKAYIRSNAPEWIFNDNPKIKPNYSFVNIDTGTCQQDFIHLDKLKSLQNYATLINEREKYADNELKFISENKISLIVGDIPPAAFYISSKANVKSVAVGNFSWDWIFEPYIQEYPEYKFITDDMIECYSQAGTLLKLPLSGDMSVFRKTIDIPLLVRAPKSNNFELKQSLGVSYEQRPIVLCSFGGFSIKGFDFISMAKSNIDCFFITFGQNYTRGDNFIILPFQSEFDHPSLVSMSDIVVSKLGYGTVAECVSTGTPIVYLSRDDFLEYPVLETAVKSMIPSYLIPKDDFFRGCWNKHLNCFLNLIYGKPKIIKCEANGADKAAEILYSLC